jgi:hypothetical protein
MFLIWVKCRKNCGAFNQFPLPCPPVIPFLSAPFPYPSPYPTLPLTLPLPLPLPLSLNVHVNLPVPPNLLCSPHLGNAGGGVRSGSRSGVGVGVG